MLIAVAVAVTIIALPAGPIAPTFGQGVLAGLAGSAASQGVGLATGLQSKLDFKGLALAGLTAGITAGVGPNGVFSSATSQTSLSGALGLGTIAGRAAEGLVGNALTQGISVATGLQKRFDWTGVAVGAVVGGTIGTFGLEYDDRSIGGYLSQAGAGVAGAIAGAATRSLIDGTDFGDNVITTLPDVIGNTIGNFAADRIASIGREDINSDLVKLTKADRAAMLPGTVRTVEIPASASVEGNASNFDSSSDNYLQTLANIFPGGATVHNASQEDWDLWSGDWTKNSIDTRSPWDRFPDIWNRTDAKGPLLDLAVGPMIKAGELAYGMGTDTDPLAGRILREWRTGDGPDTRILGPESAFSKGFAMSDNTMRVVDSALSIYASRRGGWSAQGGAITGVRGTFGGKGFIDSSLDINPFSGSQHDAEAQIIGSFRLQGQTIGKSTVQWTASNTMSLTSFFGESATGFRPVDNRFRPSTYGNTSQTIIWYTDRSGNWKPKP